MSPYNPCVSGYDPVCQYMPHVCHDIVPLCHNLAPVCQCMAHVCQDMPLCPRYGPSMLSPEHASQPYFGALASGHPFE